jgi:hypothetical protein
MAHLPHLRQTPLLTEQRTNPSFSKAYAALGLRDEGFGKDHFPIFIRTMKSSRLRSGHFAFMFEAYFCLCPPLR